MTTLQPSPVIATTPADHKGKVDFAILTIRDDEFQAVLDRFPLFTRAKGRRVYNLHRVELPGGGAYLVAVLKCIEQGNAEALDAARDVLEELEPQWLLVVGIAGGVPSDELTLGDVVVSTRIVDFSVEAVLQDKPSEYALTGGPVHKFAAAVLANLRALAGELGAWGSAASIGAPRPPVEVDDGEFYGDEAWQKKARAGLARQAARTEPVVTAGAIGSSDRLVKDTKILATFLLRAARQVLAVEMESAGVYRAATGRGVPLVAIRGLSDVVGFKRDPGWTAYACHTAAAFTRAFLLTRPIEPRAAEGATFGKLVLAASPPEPASSSPAPATLAGPAPTAATKLAEPMLPAFTCPPPLIEADQGGKLAVLVGSSLSMAPDVAGASPRAPSFAALIDEKTRDFVGREYVFAAFERFRARSSGGYFFVMGAPGCGKSAIVAEFARRSRCVVHFNQSTLHMATVRVFLDSVNDQLAARAGGPAPQPPKGAADDGRFLEGLLHRAAPRDGEEPVVLAIDALDEVDMGGARDTPLFLPRAPPRGVFFLLTTRPAPLFPVDCATECIDLDKRPNESRGDAAAYVRLVAQRPELGAWLAARDKNVDAFVETLTDKSAGNFMYLRYMLPEIAASENQDLELERLPAGLEAYYEDHWTQMGMRADPLPRAKLCVLYVLSELTQPMSRDLLAAVVHEEPLVVQKVLDAWRPFLQTVRVSGQTRYHLYHASFRDFLRRQDILSASGVSLEEIRDMIATELLRGREDDV